MNEGQPCRESSQLEDRVDRVQQLADMACRTQELAQTRLARVCGAVPQEAPAEPCASVDTDIDKLEQASNTIERCLNQINEELRRL